MVSYSHGELVVEKEELLTRTLQLHEGLGHGEVVEVLDTWCDASYPGSILASKAFTQVGLQQAGPQSMNSKQHCALHARVACASPCVSVYASCLAGYIACWSCVQDMLMRCQTGRSAVQAG
jgi:hypothetical protein